MTIHPPTRFESPLEEHRLTATLVEFRQKLEVESEEPIGNLELNAALFLDDFCRFVGLNRAQRHKVLGKAIADIAHLLD